MATSVIEILLKVRDEASKAIKNFEGAIAQAKEEVDRLNASTTGKLTKDVEKLEKQAEDTEKQIDEVADSSKDLDGARVRRPTRDIDALEDAAEDADREVGQLNNEIDELGRKRVNRINRDLDTMKTRSRDVEKNIKKLQDGFSRLNRLAIRFAALTALGSSSALGLRAAGEFSKQVAEVGTLVDDSVQSNQQLRDSILEVSNAYGQNRAEVARALYQTISAGAQAGAEANGLLEVAVKTAIGGVTTAESAVKGLSTVINAFGLETKDAATVADSLFVAMKGGQTTIGELSRFLFQAASAADLVGVQYEELLAWTTALTKQGIPTAQAFTAIRGALVGLVREPADKALAKIGQASFKTLLQTKGLAEALNLVRKAARGSDAELVKLIGGVEGLLAVYGASGERSKILTDELENQANRAGAATQAYEELADVLGSRIDIAVQNLSNAFAQLSGANSVVFLPLIESFTELVKAFSEWIELNPNLVRTFTQVSLAVAGVSAVLGILAITIGTVIRAAIGMYGAFGTLQKNLLRTTRVTGSTTGALITMRGVMRTLIGPAGLIFLVATGLTILISQLLSTASAADEAHRNMLKLGTTKYGAKLNELFNDIQRVTDRINTLQGAILNLDIDIQNSDPSLTPERRANLEKFRAELKEKIEELGDLQVRFKTRLDITGLEELELQIEEAKKSIIDQTDELRQKLKELAEVEANPDLPGEGNIQALRANNLRREIGVIRGQIDVLDNEYIPAWERAAEAKRKALETEDIPPLKPPVIAPPKLDTKGKTLAQQLAENELAVLRENSKQVEAILREQAGRGLITLQAYHKARENLVRTGFETERDLILLQLQQLGVDTTRVVDATTGRLAIGAAREAKNAAQAALIGQLQVLESQYATTIKGIVGSSTSAFEAQIQAIEDQLSSVSEQITSEAAAGLISEYEATNRLTDAREKQLQKMLALIEAVKKYRQELGISDGALDAVIAEAEGRAVQIRVEIDAEAPLNKFSRNFESSLKSGLSSAIEEALLGDSDDILEKFGDALREATASALSDVLSDFLTGAIKGGLQSIGSGVISLFPFAKGGYVQAATGGYIEAPGRRATSSSILSTDGKGLQAVPQLTSPSFKQGIVTAYQRIGSAAKTTSELANTTITALVDSQDRSSRALRNSLSESLFASLRKAFLKQETTAIPEAPTVDVDVEGGASTGVDEALKRTYAKHVAKQIGDILHQELGHALKEGNTPAAQQTLFKSMEKHYSEVISGASHFLQAKGMPAQAAAQLAPWVEHVLQDTVQMALYSAGNSLEQYAERERIEQLTNQAYEAIVESTHSAWASTKTIKDQYHDTDLRREDGVPTETKSDKPEAVRVREQVHVSEQREVERLDDLETVPVRGGRLEGPAGSEGEVPGQTSTVSVEEREHRRAHELIESTATNTLQEKLDRVLTKQLEVSRTSKASKSDLVQAIRTDLQKVLTQDITEVLSTHTGESAVTAAMLETLAGRMAGHLVQGKGLGGSLSPLFSQDTTGAKDLTISKVADYLRDQFGQIGVGNLTEWVSASLSEVRSVQDYDKASWFSMQDNRESLSLYQRMLDTTREQVKADYYRAHNLSLTERESDTLSTRLTTEAHSQLMSALSSVSEANTLYRVIEGVRQAQNAYAVPPTMPTGVQLVAQVAGGAARIASQSALEALSQVSLGRHRVKDSVLLNASRAVSEAFSTLNQVEDLQLSAAYNKSLTDDRVLGKVSHGTIENLQRYTEGWAREHKKTFDALFTSKSLHTDEVRDSLAHYGEGVTKSLEQVFETGQIDRYTEAARFENAAISDIAQRIQQDLSRTLDSTQTASKTTQTTALRDSLNRTIEEGIQKSVDLAVTEHKPITLGGLQSLVHESLTRVRSSDLKQLVARSTEAATDIDETARIVSDVLRHTQTFDLSESVAQGIERVLPGKAWSSKQQAHLYGTQTKLIDLYSHLSNVPVTEYLGRRVEDFESYISKQASTALDTSLVESLTHSKEHASKRAQLTAVTDVISRALIQQVHDVSKQWDSATDLREALNRTLQEEHIFGENYEGQSRITDIVNTTAQDLTQSVRRSVEQTVGETFRLAATGTPVSPVAHLELGKTVGSIIHSGVQMLVEEGISKTYALTAGSERSEQIVRSIHESLAQSVGAGVSSLISEAVHEYVSSSVGESLRVELRDRYLESRARTDSESLHTREIGTRETDTERSVEKAQDSRTESTSTSTETLVKSLQEAQKSDDKPGYAWGGYITGPGSGTSDSIDARLSNGEYVVQASSVKHYGLQVLEALNRKELDMPDVTALFPVTRPRYATYATGGSVEGFADRTRGISQLLEQQQAQPQTGPSTMRLEVSENALNKTMKDFLEEHFEDVMATR